MPTQFTLIKWLCAHCAQLYDTEPECHVHERDAHTADRLQDETNDIRMLEQICTRIEHAHSPHLVSNYERLCHTMLAKCIEVKMHIANAALVEATIETGQNETIYQDGRDSASSCEQTQGAAQSVENSSAIHGSYAPPERTRPQRMHTCEMCAKQFNTKRMLKEHGRTAHDHGPSDKSSTRIGEHVRRRYLTAKAANFECHICRQHFPARSQLRVHIRDCFARHKHSLFDVRESDEYAHTRDSAVVNMPLKGSQYTGAHTYLCTGMYNHFTVLAIRTDTAGVQRMSVVCTVQTDEANGICAAEYTLPIRELPCACMPRTQLQMNAVNCTIILGVIIRTMNQLSHDCAPSITTSMNRRSTLGDSDIQLSICVFLFNIKQMPSQFTFYKWLCDDCAHLCDTEPECVVHEREMHGSRVKQEHDTDDLQTLERMCTRIAHTNNVHIVDSYERLCHTLIDKCVEVKARMGAEALASPTVSEMRGHNQLSHQQLLRCTAQSFISQHRPTTNKTALSNHHNSQYNSVHSEQHDHGDYLDIEQTIHMYDDNAQAPQNSEDETNMRNVFNGKTKRRTQQRVNDKSVLPPPADTAVIGGCGLASHPTRATDVSQTVKPVYGSEVVDKQLRVRLAVGESMPDSRSQMGRHTKSRHMNDSTIRAKFTDKQQFTSHYAHMRRNVQSHDRRVTTPDVRNEHDDSKQESCDGDSDDEEQSTLVKRARAHADD